MRTLIGRAGPMLIYAPARLAGPVDDSHTAADGKVEDFWDPAGVPGPLAVALTGRPKRSPWWYWTSRRR